MLIILYLETYELDVQGGEDGGADVFLFNRTLLRPGAPLPPAEFARPLDVQGAYNSGHSN